MIVLRSIRRTAEDESTSDGTPLYADWHLNVIPSSSKVGMNVHVLLTLYRPSSITELTLQLFSGKFVFPLNHSTVCCGYPAFDEHVSVTTTPSLPVSVDVPETTFNITGFSGWTKIKRNLRKLEHTLNPVIYQSQLVCAFILFALWYRHKTYLWHVPICEQV